MADDVGEERLAVQCVLADLESNSWLPTILGEGQHQLLTLEVLSKERKMHFFVLKTGNKMRNLILPPIYLHLNIRKCCS